MNNFGDYKPIKDYIESTFDSIQVSDMENADQILSSWKKILLRIKSNVNPNEGQNLADHSRVVDYKKGILLVEADHPGWISLLQMHKNYIMKGLKIEIPELDVVTLAFRLKGKRDDVFGSRPEDKVNSRKNLMERIEEEEKVLRQTEKQLENEKNGAKSAASTELPPELVSIFDNLKQSMLTNSKK